jgi:hypothetical protein
VHGSLMFVKHVYVDVNAYVIGMRPRLVLQGCRVGVTVKVRAYYVSFISPKNMLGVVWTLLG